MFSRCMLACAGAFVSAAPPVEADAADLAFAQDFLTGQKQIVTYPVGNPAGATIVGPQTDTFTGIDFDPGANVLWAVNFAAQSVGTVNQATGAYTQSALLQGGCCLSAFTIDPVAGTFYVSKGDQYVYSLDRATGETVLLGAGTAAGGFITALAASCDGRLFAFDSSAVDGVLYQAHIGVGEPTLIGPSGYIGPTSLEFDNRSGILYAWFFSAAGGNTASWHGTVDTATAQVSQTSLVEGKYRMAIRNECSIFADGFET